MTIFTPNLMPPHHLGTLPRLVLFQIDERCEVRKKTGIRKSKELAF